MINKTNKHKGKEKIAAVVITYNRKKLLKECLNALVRQTRLPDSIIIIDNNSTDGTKDVLRREFLKNKIFDYVGLKENIGASGGFYTGIKRAYEKGFDWFWCMDDDATPKKDALINLVKSKELLESKGESDIGFLSSHVEGVNKNPMNVPSVDTKSKEGDYPEWNYYLEYGMVKLESSTFVSIIISRKAVKKQGLPIKEMFIWGVDTEYTLRISRSFNCFQVGKSKVVHKRKLQKELSILNEDNRKRINNYYFKYRNSVYIARNYLSTKRKILSFLNGFLKSFECLKSKKYKIQKSWIVFRGLLNGFFFNPLVKYV